MQRPAIVLVSQPLTWHDALQQQGASIKVRVVESHSMLRSAPSP
jgi:hypothetical protein